MTAKPGLSPAIIEYMNRIAADKGKPPPVVHREAVYVHTTDCDWCGKTCQKSYRTMENDWLCDKCGIKHLDQRTREARRKQ